VIEAAIDALHNTGLVVTVLVAIATFATVLTVTMPLLDGDQLDQRMRTMARERARLRAKQREMMERSDARGRLRTTSRGFMKEVVDQLNLPSLFDMQEINDKLKMAGMRGQRPVVAYLFFRIALPLVFLAGAVIYLFVLGKMANQSFAIKLVICLGATYVGYYVPAVFISNLISRRQTAIKRAFPDSLDLLLICVESGMSIEAAFNKVASEMGQQSIEMAEEMALTTAELSYLPERRQAYENLARRTGLEGVHAVVTSLIQAERYGTPLANALRVMAQENRDMRMSEAEKKAAALPPKLTVPMIMFFLPVIFIVILGPAAIKVLATW
jgi:tight adherence protein C